MWGAQAQEASASVADDSAFFHDGASSLRFTTDGGFDTWLWSPLGHDASWDLSTGGGLRFWVYADNQTCCGFQGPSPTIRAYSPDGSYLEWEPAWTILNDAINQWIELKVPYAGNDLWQRHEIGTPNLADIRYLEIHADTWDYGFTLWFDGLAFDLPLQPPAHLKALVGNHSVSLTWSAAPDATAIRVYRSTEPFTSVVGMAPIAELAGQAASFVDTGAANGVSYHYAVTAFLPGTGETTEVQSVGPRTPRDETDLQIACISRTPRYPRYAPIYEGHLITEPGGFGPYWFSVATGLDLGQTTTTQRFPAVGDPVTYTATIRNRGTNTWSDGIAVDWSDGVVNSHQTLRGLVLAPGQTTTASFLRPWTIESATVTCTIEAADARPSNNSRSVASDSVAFLTYLDRTYAEDFRESSLLDPASSTDDIVDWLHRHMDRFNEMFAEKDCGKRVHYDILEVLDDDAADPSVETIEFAIFPFRFRAGEGSLRTISGYYDASEDIDFGLLHEMGHQLGLVDIYRLNLGAEQNWVNGQSHWAAPCLMNGCSHFLSENSAGAMQHWLHTAHGYFGQYLYNLPETIGVRLLGADGSPLAGATVRVYQKCEREGIGEVITNQVKFSGTTGSDGVFLLPNVPLDPQLVPPTYGGDALHDNPFGYVAVVATNGLFLIEAERDGFTDYAWLDILECNNAWYAGQTGTAIFDRPMHIGGTVQQYPPADLAEQNAIDWGFEAPGFTVAFADDTTFVEVGVASVRAETDSGFDTAFVYPDPNDGLLLASWDLSKVETIRGHFRAENPWFRLVCSGGWIDLICCDVLTPSLGQWVEVSAPIAGGSGWTRMESGDPDLTKVHGLEVHADTWGYGFTLWMDGLGFEPNPLPPIPGDLDGDGHVGPTDLAILLGAWGTADPAADFDGNGTVGAADLAILLGYWG